MWSFAGTTLGSVGSTLGLLGSTCDANQLCEILGIWGF